MSESPQDYFQLLGQLSQEYHKKYDDLLQHTGNMTMDELIPQLSSLAELSIDRFRGAQQAVLRNLVTGETMDQSLQLQALIALSQCFDEMSILFQMLLSRTTRTGSE
jgi:hypothetical protein